LGSALVFLRRRPLLLSFSHPPSPTVIYPLSLHDALPICKDFLDCLRFSPTSLRWDFHLAPEFGRFRIMLNGAAAHNDHALTESCHLRGITLHSFDDNGT